MDERRGRDLSVIRTRDRSSPCRNYHAEALPNVDVDADTDGRPRDGRGCHTDDAIGVSDGGAGGTRPSISALGGGDEIAGRVAAKRLSAKTLRRRLFGEDSSREHRSCRHGVVYSFFPGRREVTAEDHGMSPGRER